MKESLDATNYLLFNLMYKGFYLHKNSTLFVALHTFLRVLPYFSQQHVLSCLGGPPRRGGRGGARPG